MLPVGFILFYFWNHIFTLRDALITSAINCVTSFIAGFVVFSVLGHMCYRLHKTMDDVADQRMMNRIHCYLYFHIYLFRSRIGFYSISWSNCISIRFCGLVNIVFHNAYFFGSRQHGKFIIYFMLELSMICFCIKMK